MNFRFGKVRLGGFWASASVAMWLCVAGPAQGAAAQADFSGSWRIALCDKDRPQAECGAFTVHLVQKGDRVCGTHNAATPGLARVDEGGPRSIVGQVVGRTAVMAIRSGRSEGVYLVSARQRSGSIDWHRQETVDAGNGDTDVIADQALLQRLPASQSEKTWQATRE
ncbi:MAG TPA: hypothetical protein VIN35_15430, partial [Hydrogenophaga sp.]